MVEKKTTRVEHVVLRCTLKLSHISSTPCLVSSLRLANIFYFEALGALDRRSMVNIFDLGAKASHYTLRLKFPTVLAADLSFLFSVNFIFG
ncbi:hypothetical protein VNO80_11393 [Phaseolus coccineus]|uniref:Uncharacterized protein n=1 Tax=Phaseolus coccineus TaxID=3886 RepID=A0AAN9NBL9_PHACN